MRLAPVVETSQQRGHRYTACREYPAVARSDCRAEKPPALSNAFGTEQACWGVVVGSADKELKMRLKITFLSQNEFANSI